MRTWTSGKPKSTMHSSSNENLGEYDIFEGVRACIYCFIASIAA